MVDSSNEEMFSNEWIRKWTWRDTLDRIQYIDTIIAQIVKDTILLNTVFFAIYGSLFYSYCSLNSSSSSQNMLLLGMVIISMAMILLNGMSSFNLALQENARQWYFHIFPVSFPLFDPPKWLDKDVDDIYKMDPRISNIEKIINHPIIIDKKKNEEYGYSVTPKKLEIDN
ncbi:hypothetical protein [Methanolobus vulcani]|uniref:Uncharacterized protein n=1 Tax=Methanolobus vulcani TaxID=38026 RepID=A0A7Z8KQV2_9EURY|nr:hypothetical protein [Methanolobus vulcani]TQD28356.1 hypothetical protein FKV42_01435 [Methanolobus vulcani]